MNVDNPKHRSILQRIAHRAMLARDLLPEFSPAALAELSRMKEPVADRSSSTLDLRDRLWCSIDNDDSEDLDQLTVAEDLPGGLIKIRVAVADVDALVKKDTAIDQHARHNTSSVYTPAEIFPMLPEQLSTDLTSLNEHEDRQAMVIEYVVGADGSVKSETLYRAWVHNHAKLAYNSLAAWLEGEAPPPEAMAAVRGLDANLRRQDQAAQLLKTFRHTSGALSLETIQAKAVFDDGQMRALEMEKKNRAKEIIEDFMIAANGATVRFLAARKFPYIRRVVRTPKRWERIVDLARERGASLPQTPDSKSLETFLVQQKAADPVDFPDLSLAVIKLLGSGEYVAEMPGGAAPGHFGLAVKDYTHSTAPNRRFTDLITQRLLKAAMQDGAPAYSMDELTELARHCTTQEDVVNKVERQVEKSAAALLLQPRIGEKFNAIVTGAADKGTWVRLLSVPVEGKLVQGFEGADVGDHLVVQLISTDVEQGFIDFRRLGRSRD